MLTGGRGILAAAAGLAALVLALGTGAYFGALNAPHYGYQTPHSAERSPQAEQNTPSQIDRDRAGLPYFAERIASGPDPEDARERELRDLAAQESMSVWAFWLLMISAAGVVVTAVGTTFLLWQIMLTREAVRDTGDATKAMVRQNEIAAHSQRPWIAISAKLLSFSITKERSFSLDCQVTFQNTGHMVAENFYALVKFVPMPEPFLGHQKEVFDRFERDEQLRDAVVIPGQSYDWTFQSNHAIEWLPWCERSGFRKDCYLMVLAMARYRIPGETTWRFAMKAFSIGEHVSHVDNRHMIYDSIKCLTVEKVTVQPMGRSRAT